MADIYGKNYNGEYNVEPQVKGDVGESGGRLRVMYDSFSGAAAGDVLHFGKLPAGARILRVSHSGLGTAPVYNFAVNDKLASQLDLQATLDVDASAAGYVFVEFILD